MQSLYLKWQRKEKSLLFLVYRWIVAVFYVLSVGVTIYQAIFDEQMTIYFIFLSNLNLCATMVTTLIGAYLATMYYSKMMTNMTDMTKIFKFYWFLWTQSLIFACLITTNYWIFLYQGKNSLSNVLKHGTNSFFLIVDLCVVKHPGRYYNFIYMVFVELAYLIFTVIYQALGGQNE